MPPGIKRKRSGSFPRYRDASYEVVNVTRVKTTAPHVLCRNDWDGDWSLQVIFVAEECLIDFWGVFRDYDSQHTIHQVRVKVPANAAARQELPEHYFGYCHRYLGSNPNTVSAWAVSTIAQRLNFVI